MSRDFYEVERPIINGAFEEPQQHWLIKKGEQPVLVPERRKASYFWKPGRKAPPGVSPDGAKVDLELVNRLRKEVKAWLAADPNTSGMSSITRELIDYWTREERKDANKQLVYAQFEAATTIIFLAEASETFKQGLHIPRDEATPNQKAEQGFLGLKRYCVKMATGSGKTTVMALLAAWSILNYLYTPHRRELYSDTILVLCPNVTIRDRLAELDTKRGKSSLYYVRDVVPPYRLQDLAQGQVITTNWHNLQPRAGNDVNGVTARVVNKGPESDTALTDRVLGPLAKGKRNILVFNDEAHHAYRIPPDETEEEGFELTEDEEEERKEATIWVDGLERINKARKTDARPGINMVVDLSATPMLRFGPDAGKMFPWVVSDFGLIDAIECGLVKIPQMPVSGSTHGRDYPEFFNLWDWIVNEKLTAGERGGKRAPINPESIVRHVKYPLSILAGDWRKVREQWQREGRAVPPVLIMVARDTKLAKALYEKVALKQAGDEPWVPEFVNEGARENTIRVDSKVVQEMEEGAKSSEARRLRFILDTVGRTKWPGDKVPEEWEAIAKEYGVDPKVPPGRDVRCIISVGMLTEGWDATTVTHILGLRPFKAQLLCEQVVGRALRRSQWNDLTIEEVAQVFGVPFEVIPFKAKAPKESGDEVQATHVHPREDRDHLVIRFPRVERFIPMVHGSIKANWDLVPPLVLDPMQVPREVVMKGMAVDEQGKLTSSGPGKSEVLRIDRSQLRVNPLALKLAHVVTGVLVGRLGRSRQSVYPEVLPLALAYLQRKVQPKGGFQVVDLMLHEPWFQSAVDGLLAGLGTADASGQIIEVPKYEDFRPEGSTHDVDFWTSRKVYEAEKSHLNFAVADTAMWEQAAAYFMDRNDHVAAYAKNFDLGFSIPYVFNGDRHDYVPDYLVRLRWEGQEVGTLILEVKGYQDAPVMMKKVAAERWCAAVNRDARYGKWAYRMCLDPASLDHTLREAAQELANARGMSRQGTLAPA